MSNLPENYLYIDIETLQFDPPDYVTPLLDSKLAWAEKQGLPAVVQPEDVDASHLPDGERQVFQLRASVDSVAAKVAAREALAEDYAKVEEKHAKEVEKRREKSSLEAIYGGRVCCISMAFLGRESGELKHPHVMLSSGGDDLELLSDFWQLLHRKREAAGDYEIVAYNGFGLDFPYLAQRALAQGLYSLASRFWFDVPWRAEGLGCPREAWYQGNRRRPGKLHELALFLGFEPRMSDWRDLCEVSVQETWEADDYETVSRKCALDNRMLQHVDQAMQGAGWR